MKKKKMTEKVFVIHGRDMKLYNYILSVLKVIGIDTLTWEEASKGTKKVAPSTLEIVTYALKTSKVVLALLTPDEIVKLKTPHQNDNNDGIIVEQARPNVIFEIGLMIGLAKTNQKIHVILCNQCGSLSDIRSVNYISFNSSNVDKFLNTLIKHLAADRLIEKGGKRAALKLANTIECPNIMNYSYLSTPEAGLAAVLPTQGLSENYYDILLESSNIQILGVKQEGMLHSIKKTIERQNIKRTIKERESDFERLKKKKIQILIAGNEYYADMINKMEMENNRSIVNKNITNLLDIIELKNSNDNFKLKMHLYANSCTIRIFDDIMWLTPYTHHGGANSPTFIISKYENPDIYQYYSNYFDYLWHDASVSVKLKDDVQSLRERLEKKYKKLGLLDSKKKEDEQKSAL
jgi:Predicted nucleotide-binding protein containing TIR -like domain